MDAIRGAGEGHEAGLSGRARLQPATRRLEAPQATI